MDEQSEGLDPPEYHVAAAQGMSWTLVHRVVQQVAALAWLLLIPRILGPDHFGVYAFATALVLMSSAILNLGISASFGRWFAALIENDLLERAEMLATGGAVLRIALGLVAAIAVGLIMQLFSPLPVSGLVYLMTAIMVFLHFSTTGGTQACYGAGGMNAALAPVSIRAILVPALVVPAYHAWRLEGAFVGTAAAHLVATGTGLWWAREFFVSPFAGDIDWRWIWSKLRYGTAEWLSIAMQGGARRAATILLAVGEVPSAGIALFSVANRVQVAYTDALSTLARNLTPYLSRLHEAAEKRRIIRWTEMMSRYCAWLQGLLIVFLAFFGNWFFVTVVGPEYADVKPLALIIAFAVLPLSLITLWQSVGAAMGKPVIGLIGMGTQNVVFLAVFFGFSARWDSLGAAVAIPAASIPAAIVAWIAVYKTLQIRLPVLRMLGTLALALAPCLFLLSGPAVVENPISGIGAMLLCVGLPVITGLLPISEFAEIWRAIRHKQS